MSQRPRLGIVESTRTQAAVLVALAILVGNVGALVDAVVHPEIPYFDQEHLLVGGVTAFVSLVLSFLLLRYGRQLSTREAQLWLVFNTTTQLQALIRVEPDGRFVFDAVNPLFLNTMRHGFASDTVEATGREWSEWLMGLGRSRETAEADLPFYREAAERRHAVEYESSVPGPDGHVTLEVTIVPLIDADGTCTHLLYTGRDITARKRAEEQKVRLEDQLRQAQKMESVGRLAGGVAHEFNNMLAVILGYTELALERVAPADPLRADLEETRKAAMRSADVTRQLLAFARKQIIAPRVLNLNEVVADSLQMLGRLIGEDIRVGWHPAADLWAVKVDPSQMGQILSTLCLNARDAISGTGHLTIQTGNTTIDEAYCAVHPECVPGEYVFLAVSDDGCGMDKETLAKLFEPFFTTKDVSRGAGLGLATVYGMVRQNAGFVDVSSELGIGTTFRIHLPRHIGETIEAQSPAVPDHPRGHGETVLVVEDEAAILTLATEMLERLGYRVLTAGSPEEALRLTRQHAGEIHLLLTDVVMPEMNGRELAMRVVALRPQVRSLFMSGYPTDILAQRGVLEGDVHFIQKPFAKGDLAIKVRDVLEGERA